MKPKKRESAYEKIYAIVRQVPEGFVTTYGEVARMAGLPGWARQVGYALHALGQDDRGVPWQRVVNARGEVSERGDPGWAALQRSILRAEGIVFDTRGRINLTAQGWGASSSSQL